MGLKDLERQVIAAKFALERARLDEQFAVFMEVSTIGSITAARDAYKDAVQRGDHQGAVDNFRKWQDAVAEGKRRQRDAIRASLRTVDATQVVIELEQALGEMRDLQRGLIDLGGSKPGRAPGSGAWSGLLGTTGGSGAAGWLPTGSRGSPPGTNPSGSGGPGMTGTGAATSLPGGSSLGRVDSGVQAGGSSGTGSSLGSSASEMTKSSPNSGGGATSGSVIGVAYTMSFESWTTNENGAAIVAGLTAHTTDPMREESGLTGNPLVDDATMRNTRFQLGFHAPPQGPSRALHSDEQLPREVPGFDPSTLDPNAPVISPGEGYTGRRFYPPRQYDGSPVKQRYIEALHGDQGTTGDWTAPGRAAPHEPPPPGGDPAAVAGMVVFSAGVRSATINLATRGVARAGSRR